MAVKEITQTADSLLDVERTFADRLAYFGRFLWRDRSGVVGLVVFAIVVLSAIFAPVLSPHDHSSKTCARANCPRPGKRRGGGPILSAPTRLATTS